MRRLVIFASCLGVGVCVDSGGGGGDGRWNSRVPVERVGGGACARQVTWHSRARGGGGFAGLRGAGFAPRRWGSHSLLRVTCRGGLPDPTPNTPKGCSGG